MTKLSRSLIPPVMTALEPASHRALSYGVIGQLWSVVGTTWSSGFKESFGNLIDLQILLDAERGIEHSEDYRDTIVDTVTKFVLTHEDIITTHLQRVAPEILEECTYISNTSTAIVLGVSDTTIADESMQSDLVPVKARPFYNPLCLRRIPQYQNKDMD